MLARGPALQRALAEVPLPVGSARRRPRAGWPNVEVLWDAPPTAVRRTSPHFGPYLDSNTPGPPANARDPPRPDAGSALRRGDGGDSAGYGAHHMTELPGRTGPSDSDMYTLISACSTWVELRALQHRNSAQLLPAHVPAFMAAAAKLLASGWRRGRCGGGSAGRRPGDTPADAGPLAGVSDSAASAAAPVSRATLHDGSDDTAGALAYVWDLASSALRLARARELPPRSLATALWAAAKLPLGPPAAEQGRAGGATLGRDYDSPRPHSSAVHALPHADWQGWAVEMLRCCGPFLERFSPRDISQTLWAVTTLQCGPLPAKFMFALLGASRQQLPAFGPQAISNSLWALARLRFRPPVDWLDAACAAAEPQLRAFGPQALANTAHALAQLEYLPPPEWCARFLDACGAMWAEQAAPQAVASAVAVAPPALPPPQSVALIAWAVTRLGMQPSAAWLDGLAGAAAAAAPRMNGQDVANVLWALGVQRQRLGGVWQPPEQHLAPLLAAWWRCTESMEPQQLSACLVAAAHMGLREGQQPGPEEAPAGAAVQGSGQLPVGLVRRTLECVARRLPAASAQCVANVMWAAARLGCRPPSSWVGGVTERFMECLEDYDAGPQELAMLWWALGRLRWAPPAEAVQELLTRSLAAAAAGDMRSGELAMVMWGVARLGLQLPKPMLDRLVRIVRLTCHHEALAAEQPEKGEGAGAEAAQGRGAAAGTRGATAAASRAAYRAAVPLSTLTTLLRALSCMEADSQRSTVEAVLERSLRRWLAGPRAAGAEPQAAAHRPRADADVARQLALLLHATASVGCYLGLREGRQPHTRGLAGAMVEAVRVLLPHFNPHDLAMALWALACMEATLPLNLLAATLAHAGALCECGALAGPGDLPLVLCGLGQLLHVNRRRTRGAQALAAMVAYRKPPPGAAASARWAEKLREPRLAAARSALLRAVEDLVRSPAARRALSARDALQLVRGLATCLLVPQPAVLSPLVLALVRRWGDAGLSLQQLALNLYQLAGMGADMHPRVAVLLLRRLLASEQGRALQQPKMQKSRGLMVVAVRSMVARWVLRRGSAAGDRPSWLDAAHPESKVLLAAAQHMDPQAMSRVRAEMLPLLRVAWVAG